MSTIKLHLETEELAAVDRVAKRFNLGTEALVFFALDRLMLQLNDPAVRAEVQQTGNPRGKSLALWSDSARSVHIYESQPDGETRRSRYLKMEDW